MILQTEYFWESICMLGPLAWGRKQRTPHTQWASALPGRDRPQSCQNACFQVPPFRDSSPVSEGLDLGILIPWAMFPGTLMQVLHKHRWGCLRCRQDHKGDIYMHWHFLLGCLGFLMSLLSSAMFPHVHVLCAGPNVHTHSHAPLQTIWVEKFVFWKAQYAGVLAEGKLCYVLKASSFAMCESLRLGLILCLQTDL